jgi:pyrimidine deaminase RibD-like protein
VSDLEVSMMRRVGELNKEVTALKAEIEMLNGQVRYWKIEAECDHGRWLRCLEDLEKLRASSFVTAVPVEQYESIVRAGDLMLKFASANIPYPPYVTMAKDWLAAKEGK